MTFGDWLKSRLKRNKQKQTELASACGASRAAVCQWCKDINGPSSAVLEPMAKFLGVSVDELVKRL